MSIQSVSITSSRFITGHVSVHADGEIPTLARPFKRAYDELRSIDGIDEFATLVGQIFPKLGQSIVTLGVVVPATPFVAMGAAGAISESIEHFKEIYPDLMLDLASQKSAIFDQLRKEGLTGTEITEIETKFEKALAYLRENGSDKLRYQIDLYERADADRKIERLERNASVLGAAGMTAMTVGMGPMAVQAAAGIVEHTANQVFYEGMMVAKDAGIVGSTAALVGGAIVLPAQIAIAVQGGVRVVNGIKADKALKKSSAAIGKLVAHPEYGNSISGGAKESAQELLARRRYYNAHHSISAGSATAAGQSLMAAGTVASMGVVSAPIGLALTAAGAPLTIGGAVQRVVYLNKEKRALGEKASSDAKQKELDLLPSMEAFGFAETVRAASSRVTDRQDGVARSKLHSLIQHVLDKEIKRGKRASAESRLAELEKLARTGRKSFFTRTTLLKSDLEVMRSILSDYSEEGFFEGTAAMVQGRLHAKADSPFDGTYLDISAKSKARVLKKTVREVVKNRKLTAGDKGPLALAPKQRRKDITMEQMLQAARHNDTVNGVFRKHLTRTLIEQTKTDSKYLRNDATNKLAGVAVSATKTNTAAPQASLTHSGSTVTANFVDEFGNQVARL